MATATVILKHSATPAQHGHCYPHPPVPCNGEVKLLSLLPRRLVVCGAVGDLLQLLHGGEHVNTKLGE